MPDVSPSDAVVVMFCACQPLGVVLAQDFARTGFRVIAIDDDAKALALLAGSHLDRIEPLAIPAWDRAALDLLKEAWGREPIALVVNLAPLRAPIKITQQLHILSRIIRTVAHGMAAGKGCLVSVVPRPADPLALVGQGMWAALWMASRNLGKSLARRRIRVHAIAVPPDQPERALDILHFLGSEKARHICSTAFDLHTAER